VRWCSGNEKIRRKDADGEEKSRRVLHRDAIEGGRYKILFKRPSGVEPQGLEHNSFRIVYAAVEAASY
jgi:hypothetical protein